MLLRNHQSGCKLIIFLHSHIDEKLLLPMLNFEIVNLEFECLCFLYFFLVYAYIADGDPADNANISHKARIFSFADMLPVKLTVSTRYYKAM